MKRYRGRQNHCSFVLPLTDALAPKGPEVDQPGRLVTWQGFIAAPFQRSSHILLL